MYFSNWLKRFLRSPRTPYRRAKSRRFVPRLEVVEDRTVPSTIVWTNRGNVSDQFDAAFGSNANAARNVIDAALDHWERIIPSFNTAADGNVPANTFHVSFTMEQLLGGLGGTNGKSTLLQLDATGRPRRGSIKLDFNGSPNNDPGVFNWFVDPTPFDHSEFLRNDPGTDLPYEPFRGRAQAGSPADDKVDLFTVASHEMYHLLGLHPGSSLRLNSTPGLVTSTGVPDGPGTLLAFNGASMQMLLTSSDGSGAESGPSHMATSAQTIPGGLRGGGGLGTLSTDRGLRHVQSLVDSLFLRDAYGYTTVDPEAFGTFYSTLNTTTGELTVRGQFGNFLSDQIRVTQSGGVITTSVDITGDLFPNGTPIDAFVTTYPASSVSKITIIGTDADAITIGVGVTVPVTVIGGAGNFNSLNLEGGGNNEIFTVGANSLNGNRVGQVGGSTSITFTDISTLGISGQGGDDVVNFSSASANAMILKGGAGNDTFNISPTARNLNDVIPPLLSVVGEDGTDSLILDDRNTSASQTFVITNNQVTRNGSQLVNTTTIEGLTLHAGSAADIFNIQSTAAATPVVINGGNGNDDFNVGLNNNMNAILSPLTLTGQGGDDDFRLNDQAAATANNYSVFNTRIERSNGPAIFLDAGDVTLQAPNTANTIRVESLDGASDYELIGNGGDDTFDLSPTSQLFSLLLSQRLLLRGAGGTDTLFVHDEARPNAGTYVGFSNLITSDFGGEVDFDTMEIVTFNAGLGNDTLNVEGGGGATNPVVVNAGPGNDTFNLTPDTDNFDFIFGMYTLIGGQGTDGLIVHDTARTTNANVVFTDASISRPGSGRPPITLSSVENLEYNAGSSDDVLDASAVTIPVTLRGNDGNDTITGGSNNDNLIGGLGADLLVGNDGNDLLSAGGFRASDTLLGGNGNDTAADVASGAIVDLGQGQDGVLIVGTDKNDVISIGRKLGLNGAQAVVTLNGEVIVHDYRNGETITVLAGRGNDLVTLETSAGVTWTALFDGEEGNDTLIGSSGADILRGGDGNDELHGEVGNDVVLGGSGSDKLFGGDGRDLLIGGDGADRLVGDAGDDILIGGRTSFDDNTAPLSSLMAEWTRVDHSYDQRVASLRNGGGLNGEVRLLASGPGATVHDDGNKDRLSGDSGLDWYFANLTSSVLDGLLDLDDDEIQDEV